MEPQHPQLPAPHGTPFLRIFALLVFALIIAVLSSLGTSWYINNQLTQQQNIQQTYQSPPTIEPKVYVYPTVSQDEIANWKTYEDTEFGFSLKYPPELKVEGSKISDPNIYLGNLITIKTQSLPITGLAWYDSTYRKNETDVVVGGVKGIRFEFDHPIYPTTPEIVTVLRRNVMMEFWLFDTQPENKKIFDQILSTLKFSSNNSPYTSKDFYFSMPEKWVKQGEQQFPQSYSVFIASPDYVGGAIGDNSVSKGARIRILELPIANNSSFTSLEEYFQGKKESAGYAGNEKRLIINKSEAIQYDNNFEELSTNVYFLKRETLFYIGFTYSDIQTKNKYLEDFDFLLQSFIVRR